VRPRLAEIVEHNSKSGVRKDVGVRFPPSALRRYAPIVRRIPDVRPVTHAVLALVIGGLALAAVGCGAAHSSSCAQIDYEGAGSPDYILASDLPLQGASRTRSLQINDAIRAELKARMYKAGSHTIGFQACDDSTAAAGRSDPGTCRSNADAYVDNDQVIGVIGPLDSSCAAILIPALNEAPGGAIPIVSPSNTYPCLTVGGAGCDVSEPGKYYPSGKRNYLRVVANDVFQGAADAELARDKGSRKVYVLHDSEAYGVGIATAFRNAAESLGIEVVGFEGWDPKASSYASLFEQVRSSGADAIFLGGLIDQNVGPVIEAKVAALGPNDGAVKLLSADGFTAQQASDAAGTAAQGMTVSAVGVPYAELPRRTKRFADALAAQYLGGRSLDPTAIYGAQAARVMLDAIAKSNGTRAGVTAKLFQTDVRNGLLGTFRFDANGDPADASGPVVGFTILNVARPPTVETTVEPAGSTVRAAAGG
jgi:branched-chain amino acid transport system substrate-binding protein